MAVTYLGKKRMHELLKQYNNKPINSMKWSHYEKYRGAEWIVSYSGESNIVKLGSMYGGQWLHLVEKDDDGNVVRDEVVKTLSSSWSQPQSSPLQMRER